MSRAKVDVGVVYRRGERLFLSLAENVLVAGEGGELRRYRPRRSDRQVRGITVGDLCERWGVDVEAIDGLAEAHLDRPHPREARGGSSRRRSGGVDWQRMRLQTLRTR